ncbi:hypothetical protein WP7S18C02_24840 [Klebsiella sp. WP7-S18-CRE-02]|nr:hypothetical protein WP7S18C02_24840 [Klebsiella sp. WP7-S18-CRE-02]BBS96891.1 hypothetical protein WP7S18C03_24840 [Klebsiella sp. WP7-S18-CRE-03]BBT01924.1 hypothetical protein WP7S18E04_24860 [Klebsiella sp. WP7-S18-ESBL-04]
MIYAELSQDEKSVEAVFSCPQEHSTEIERSDARYIEFYNAQPSVIQQMLPGLAE